MPYSTRQPFGDTALIKPDIQALDTFLAQASRGVYNVREYGALGDGATNDTSAIQAAIDAASTAGGGMVALPPGSYPITGLTITHDYVELVGSGPSTLLIGTSAALGNDLITIGDGVTTYSGCALRDLRLGSNGQKTGGAGIRIRKGYRTWLDRLFLTNQYRAVWVQDSTALWFSQSDVRDTSENAIFIDSTLGNGFEWYLSEILCDNPTVTNGGTGLYWDGGESLHVNHCNFQRFQNAVVVTASAGRESRFGFFNALLADFASDNNIRITNASTGNVVGLEFQNCWSGTATNYGVLMDRPGSGIVQGMKWIGGKIFHNGLAGARMAGGQDFHLQGVEIIGNSQTVSANRHGVEVGGAFTNWSVINCRIGGGYSQGDTQGYAISIDAGAADYYRILGNDCATGNNNTPVINDGGTGTHKAVANNLT